MASSLLKVLTEPTVEAEVSFEVLGIGRNTGYRACKSGEIPTIRVGRQYRVPSEVLLSRLGLSDPKIREATLRRLLNEQEGQETARRTGMEAQAAA